MRITDIHQAAKDVQKNSELDGKHGQINPNKTFKGQVTSLTQEKHQQYVNNLIDEITKQGEKIGLKADIKEFQKYRRLITELLNDTAVNSFEYSKNEGFGTRNRHRSFAIIKNINKKLDDLTQEVLSEQKDKINIMGMIDDIRGMLVDMFL